MKARTRVIKKSKKYRIIEAKKSKVRPYVFLDNGYKLEKIRQWGFEFISYSKDLDSISREFEKLVELE